MMSAQLESCPVCGDQTHLNGRAQCSACRRWGKPDAGTVPYKVGDDIHTVSSPRTKYRVIEIRPADIHYRRGSVKVCRVLRDGTLRKETAYHWRPNPGLETISFDNDRIIEWRKANMRDLPETEVKAAIEWADRLWDRAISKYREGLRKAKQHDDPGTCVLGAGIKVSNILGKQIAFIHVPASAGQGATTWEESVGDVVAYLRGVGLDAEYEAGRMD